MSDLLEYLSAYVREQAPRFLSDPEYAQNRAYRDWHFSWLQDHLDPEALRHLADFEGHLFLAACAEEESLIRAALSVGARLGALGQLAE